jgi:glycerol-1-phosphate dehydrogenase [NAD(P)+]
MSDFFFESYLSKYGTDGTLNCGCGRQHSLGAKRVLLGDGVIEKLPDLVEQMYGSGSGIWILSDENTETAAAAWCKELLSRFHLSQAVLPARPRPRTTPELIHTLAADARGVSPDLILAVGGGTISDIGKMVSKIAEVPNWCVATAPSVDAYSSGTSALKLKAGHRTEACTPTEVIFAELAVLEQAPEKLFLSGIGDLLAKYLSYLDWTLSALITGEYICGEVARLCLDSARQAIQAVKIRTADRKGAIRALTDAILTSGFAMQGLSDSRPASSAEHTVAHFWEIAGSVGNPAYELHGLLVGLSCRILLEGYAEFYQDPTVLEITVEERLLSLAAESPWDQGLVPEMEAFRGHMQEEMSDSDFNAENYRLRLEQIQKNVGSIIELAGRLLEELEGAVAVLAGLSFPFRLSEFQIDPQQVLLPIRHIRFLRSRYSTFDLMHEVGAEEKILRHLEAKLASLR